jgi:hypothetical protein
LPFAVEDDPEKLRKTGQLERVRSAVPGEFAFKVGGREIGHLHGDHVAHFGFPKQVWASLFEQKHIATAMP